MRYEAGGSLEFQLNNILNNGLVVEDNFDWAILEVELALGENTIQHGMGRVPSGYIVIYTDSAVTITGSSIESWTTEQLLLTSSAASPRVRLFVL